MPPWVWLAAMLVWARPTASALRAEDPTLPLFLLGVGAWVSLAGMRVLVKTPLAALRRPLTAVLALVLGFHLGGPWAFLPALVLTLGLLVFLGSRQPRLHPNLVTASVHAQLFWLGHSLRQGALPAFCSACLLGLLMRWLQQGAPWVARPRLRSLHRILAGVMLWSFPWLPWPLWSLILLFLVRGGSPWSATDVCPKVPLYAPLEGLLLPAGLTVGWLTLEASRTSVPPTGWVAWCGSGMLWGLALGSAVLAGRWLSGQGRKPPAAWKEAVLPLAAGYATLGLGAALGWYPMSPAPYALVVGLLLSAYLHWERIPAPHPRFAAPVKVGTWTEPPEVPPVQELTLVLGRGLLGLIDVNQCAPLLDEIPQLRKRLMLELGFPLGPVSMKVGPPSAHADHDGCFRILVNEREIRTGHVPRGQIYSVEGESWVVPPAEGLKPAQYIARELGQVVRESVCALWTLERTEEVLARAAQSWPRTVAYVLDRHTRSELRQFFLDRLVRGESVRDVQTLLNEWVAL